MAGMTFAEAYALRKKAETRVSNYRKGRKELDTVVTNISDLNTVMHRIVTELEEDAKNVVKNTKSTLSEIPTHFAKHVTDWQDEHHLGILHHFIINNKPELVQFIYTETNYFPFGHSPTHTPYAHLAAILGHTECLRQILISRPTSFFKTDRPSHLIKLPGPIIKRMKLNETKRAMSKGVEKVLEKIKGTTKQEEKKMQEIHRQNKNESDIVEALDQELGAIEKNFNKKKRRLPRASLHKIEKRKTITNLKVSDSETSRSSVSSNKQSRSSACARYGYLPTVDSFRNHLVRRLGPENCKHREHMITVFWDALSDLEPGVIKGAGDPVTLQMTPQAHLSRKVDLDRADFNDISRLSSAKSLSQHKRLPMLSKSHLSTLSASTSNAKSNISNVDLKRLKSFEIGVRGKKKYKDFHLSPNTHTPLEVDDSDKHMNKTPLTYAAERGHIECVQLILDMVVLKRYPSTQSREPVTLATKARSPESILLLMEKRPTRSDLQSAVMLAIREMFPDCLTALLTAKEKERSSLFEGTNLYHILYSQSVMSSKRYEFMPEMTRALISCKEDVNAHGTLKTYPMYTLINCAFNIVEGKQITFFIDCLQILLECKASPHYDENKQARQTTTRTEAFSRPCYTSAIHCVFESAKNSVNFFETTYWSKVFTKKFISTIESHDITPRRVLNVIFFDYMNVVCTLGLDRTIVRCLLRYGGNPDHKRNGKYAVNVYFDQLFPYMTRFEIIGSYDHYLHELATLMIICRHMRPECLAEALVIFLSEHLLSAPIQALPISRQFAAMMNTLLRTPRSLADMAGQCIWLRLKRDKMKVRELRAPEECVAHIIPS